MKILNLSIDQQNEVSAIKTWQDLIQSGRIEPDAVQQQLKMISKRKEKLVKDIYFKARKRKDFYRCSDGRVKSRNPDFIAPTEEQLLEKLYEHYFGNCTLESIYKSWVKYRSDNKLVSPKTIEEDIGIWKRFISTSDLAKMKVDEIKPKHLTKLFDKWVGNMQITKKDFNNRKSVLNGILGYAILEERIEVNPLTSVPTNKYKFKPPRRVKKAYSPEEREILLKYLNTLEPDAYVLAIKLAFHALFRIGEIKGLKWDISDFTQIQINEQIVEERTLQDDMTLSAPVRTAKYPKGNPDYSIRTQEIAESAVSILTQMKQLNPDGEYLFMYKGRPLTTDTFNRRLRKYCDATGIEYLSSHKIRFTGATLLHNSHIKMTVIQQALGHSTVAMTYHYLNTGILHGDLKQAALVLA